MLQSTAVLLLRIKHWKVDEMAGSTRFGHSFMHSVHRGFLATIASYVHVPLVNVCNHGVVLRERRACPETHRADRRMNSIPINCGSVRSVGRLGSVRAPFSKATFQPDQTVARRVNRQTRRMAILNGDIVADDKKTNEKTAAASSRGFAGLPERPEDMQQSTPAASSFMQVSLLLDFGGEQHE